MCQRAHCLPRKQRFAGCVSDSSLAGGGDAPACRRAADPETRAMPGCARSNWASGQVGLSAWRISKATPRHRRDGKRSRRASDAATQPSALVRFTMLYSMPSWCWPPRILNMPGHLRQEAAAGLPCEGDFLLLFSYVKRSLGTGNGNALRPFGFAGVSNPSRPTMLSIT